MHRPTLAVAIAFSCLTPLHVFAGDVALQCEHLFDSRKGQMLGAHTVLVRDGKVAEVRAGRVDVPGAQVIDLAGHSCTPGWTDLHVHLGDQSSPRSYEEEFRLSEIGRAHV